MQIDAAGRVHVVWIDKEGTLRHAYDRAPGGALEAEAELLSGAGQNPPQSVCTQASKPTTLRGMAYVLPQLHIDSRGHLHALVYGEHIAIGKSGVAWIIYGYASGDPEAGFSWRWHCVQDEMLGFGLDMALDDQNKPWIVYTEQVPQTDKKSTGQVQILTPQSLGTWTKTPLSTPTGRWELSRIHYGSSGLVVAVADAFPLDKEPVPRVVLIRRQLDGNWLSETATLEPTTPWEDNTFAPGHFSVGFESIWLNQRQGGATYLTIQQRFENAWYIAPVAQQEAALQKISPDGGCAHLVWDKDSLGQWHGVCQRLSAFDPKDPDPEEYEDAEDGSFSVTLQAREKQYYHISYIADSPLYRRHAVVLPNAGLIDFKMASGDVPYILHRNPGGELFLATPTPSKK